MYFVNLPEREKMMYATRVEALRGRFGQETDTSITLQELAGLRRGKNQSEGRHGMSLVPPKRTLREGVPDQRNRRTFGKQAVAAVTIDAGPQEGAATEETVMLGNGLYLPGQIEGNGVSFLVDTGSGVSIMAARTWRKWGRAEDELRATVFCGGTSA